MVNRMKKVDVGSNMREKHTGREENSSWTEKIANLRIIIEKSQERNFIDLKKPLTDKTGQYFGISWGTIDTWGGTEKLVTLTRKMYEDTVCKVIHEGQLSESLE